MSSNKLFPERVNEYIIFITLYYVPDAEASQVAKEFSCQAEDANLVPESGRSPREENEKPLSILARNPMDRGATSWATVHGGLKRNEPRRNRSHTETNTTILQ